MTKSLFSFISCLALLGVTQIGAGAAVITHPVRPPRIMPQPHNVNHTITSRTNSRIHVKVPARTITTAPRPVHRPRPVTAITRGRRSKISRAFRVTHPIAPHSDSRRACWPKSVQRRVDRDVLLIVDERQQYRFVANAALKDAEEAGSGAAVERELLPGVGRVIGTIAKTRHVGTVGRQLRARPVFGFLRIRSHRKIVGEEIESAAVLNAAG